MSTADDTGVLRRLMNKVLGRNAEIRADTGEAYKAARVTRLTKDWQPEHRSGDAATRESWPLLTARSRDLVRNTPTYKRARSVLTDLVVGSGVLTRSAPVDPTSILGDSLDEQSLERDLGYSFESDELFERWSNEDADIRGELSWYELQRMAFAEMMTTGTSLLLECRRVRSGRVSVCYQLLEREQLDHTKDQPRTNGTNRIENGIEVDAVNRAVAYHIFDEHPNDGMAGTSFGSTRIPARRIIHLFLPHRPSMTTGICWFHAMVQASRDKDFYLGNELTAGAINALYTVVMKMEDAGSGTGFADGDAETDLWGNPLIKLGAGIVQQIGPKDTLEAFDPKRPNSNAVPFIKMMDRDIAAGAGLSYVRQTGDYEGISYSAGRAAHLDDELTIKPLQKFLGRKIAIPVRQKINAEAAAAGMFTSYTPRQFARDAVRLQRLDLLPQGREQLDPEAETEASVTKMRAGLSNLSIECGKRGLHWMSVLRQIALENRVSDRLGVVIDKSKGQGAQVESSTSSRGSRREASDAT